MRIALSLPELVSELEAESSVTRSDPTGLGLDLLQLHTLQRNEGVSGVLESASNTIYDIDLLLSFARAARFLFHDMTYAERFYVRAVEASNWSVRPAWHHMEFLANSGRHEEAVDLMSRVQQEGEVDQQAFLALLVATHYEADGHLEKDLLEEGVIKVPSTPESPHSLSLVADAVAIYCRKFLIEYDEQDAYAKLRDLYLPLPHLSLGFGRFAEMTYRRQAALRYYRMAHRSSKTGREVAVAVPFVRGWSRAPLSWMERIGWMPRSLMTLLRRWSYALWVYRAQRLLEKLAKAERRHSPRSFTARKQTYVFLRLAGKDEKADRLRRELNSMGKTSGRVRSS